jgi:hypothetical protein
LTQELTYKLFESSKQERCEKKSFIFDSIALGEPRNHQFHAIGLVLECFSAIRAIEAAEMLRGECKHAMQEHWTRHCHFRHE